ncbi:MAG TPA: hypothetical protein VK017_15340, partial [Sphingobacterium sp.]|nr:hypothetical protein [Sphingobacterium sp.]
MAHSLWLTAYGLYDLWPLAIRHPLSAYMIYAISICHLLSAICYLPLAIRHQPSTTSHPLSAICHLPSALRRFKISFRFTGVCGLWSGKRGAGLARRGIKFYLCTTPRGRDST